MNELGEQLAELWSDYLQHLDSIDDSVGNIIQAKRQATVEGMLNWLVSLQPIE